MKTRYACNSRVSYRAFTGLVVIASMTLSCANKTTPIADRKPDPAWYEIAKPPSASSDDEERRLCYTKRSGEKPTREEALRLLLKTNIFASNGIGYGMDLSAQVQAFLIILAEPDAAPAFRHLLVNGNMAGRLYALIGLRAVDPALFDREIGAYLLDESMVRTFFGCILSGTPVHRIAADIYNDYFGSRFTSRAKS